jgi:hypothetical protein
MTHKKEPWIAEINGDMTQIGAWSPAGRQVIAYCYAKVHPVDGYKLGGCNQPKEEAEANARRIVACVNACAGVDTEFLERTHDKGHESGIRKHMECEQQRNKLLLIVRGLMQKTPGAWQAAETILADIEIN